jgi:hypothetical protein
MAAATAPFPAPELTGKDYVVGLAASTRIWAGTMVSLNAAGRAIPAADTASTRVIGRAEQSVDNSAGSAGDLSIQVKPGCFKFNNSATQPVTIASIGLVCYVEDDNTVAIAAGPTNDIKAGIVVRVDADGVFVDLSAAPLI